MAFGDPMQWIIIGIVVVVIFMWGPQKIPELARSLGLAKGEFDKAQKEFQAAAAGTAMGPGVTNQYPLQAKTGDEALIETAQKLGITTQEKTREEISQEILAKAQKVA